MYVSHFLDHKVREEYADRLLPQPVSIAADYYGRGLNYALANGFIWVHGASVNRSSAQCWRDVQILTEAVGTTIVFTAAIKYSVRRLRPNGQNRRSFPSGHTSGSFAVAMVMQQLYGYKVGIPAFILASITGMQRIHADKHWLSDVLAGALLGGVIGKGFAEVDRNCDKKGEWKVSYCIVF